MPYVLGIDLGTTYSAAATNRDGRVQIFHLGSRAATIPSVVLLRDTGEVLTGEVADRRATTEPLRTAREFKRRLGDPTPLLLGSTPYGAEALMAHLLRAIVKQVTEQEGEAPARIAVTHPANFGPYKLDLMREMARLADVGDVQFLTEPLAAALHYASLERVEAGTVVAVYDFGGGTFDAAILRKTDDGFEPLGQPEGMERLGGIDFDEALFQYVLRSLGNIVTSLDPADAATTTAIARLREDCREAKEQLSADTDATVPVMLPGIQTEVRITREEFEDMVRPRIRETVASLERSVRSAGLQMEQVDRILLAGGTSRIPLVGQLIRESTGRPVAVDTHPKHAIALGAAQWVGAASVTPAPATTPAPPSSTSPAAPGSAAEPATPVPATLPAPASDRTSVATGPEQEPHPEAGAVPSPQPAPAAAPTLPRTENRPPPEPSAGQTTARRLPAPLPLLIGAPLTLVAVIAAAFLLLGGDGSAGDEPGDTAAMPSPTATSTPAQVAAAEPVVTLGKIRITGRNYLVPFETEAFTPAGGPEHLHFFWGNLSESEGALPGAGPWAVHQSDEPFSGFALDERPADARSICAVVVNADHTLRPGSSRCSDLPEPLIPAGVDYSLITSIAVEGGAYVVDFETFGYDPAVPGQHVHFFFDTTSPTNAGVPGSGPWTLYGGGSPFTLLGPGDRPSGATQLCVLVANPDHSIHMETGNCADLP